MSYQASWYILDDIIGGGSCGESSVVELTKTNHTVCHKYCRYAVVKQKVDRPNNKIERMSQEQGRPMKTRRMNTGSVCEALQGTSTEGNDSSGTKCLFCEASGDMKILRKASTLGLNKNQ